jgi:membrane-bound serine protease (ClpP class)
MPGDRGSWAVVGLSLALLGGAQAQNGTAAPAPAVRVAAPTAPTASPEKPASAPAAALAAPSASTPSAPIPAPAPANLTSSATPTTIGPAADQPAAAKTPVSVYVVPIEGEIDDPQFYILRRALKEAMANHVDAVVLDMDTLGGALSTTTDMMDALAHFTGRTYTFVNDKAMSAGSYIAVATNEIYFAPTGTIGAAEAVGGSGEDIGDTMTLKINSFMEARVRVVAGPNRYRADVQRAMMDPNFEFKIGGQVIKPAGQLLSLTAAEACAKYGRPPEPLLGAGIAPNARAMLDQVYGPDGYTVRDFHLTWSEQAAKLLNEISPILVGAGILLLVLEFKAPGSAFFGILGVTLLLLVFVSHYLAGLAGYEPVALFFIGIVCIALELLVFPGSVACGAIGLLCFFGSLVWAMTDVWPADENYGLTPGSFAGPLFNVVLGVVLAGGAFAVLLRFLPKTWVYKDLVLRAVGPRDNYAAASGAATATGATTLPEAGARGVALTDLRPLGEIDIAGGRFQARAVHGQIDRGVAVVVVGRKDFALAVRRAE